MKGAHELDEAVKRTGGCFGSGVVVLDLNPAIWEAIAGTGAMQRLKPLLVGVRYGTTEVVPSPE
jgi:hypothetical protein